MQGELACPEARDILGTQREAGGPVSSSHRPLPQPGHLKRPRLLKVLPERAGLVAWLHAPYGYGKTTLLSQWTEACRRRGVPVLWVNGRAHPQVRLALARFLGLGPKAQWGAILESLEELGPVVVLDEAEFFEEPPPIEEMPAAVGVASRKKLDWPGIAKLRGTGRLSVVGPRQLAFTRAEAEQLFGAPDRARAAWRATGGWPLALHLSALTGEDSVEGALVRGIRESLGPRAWRAALLLATVPVLPEEFATQEARQLVEAGFAVRLEGGGYQLHDFVAQTLRRGATKVLTRVVRRAARSLPAWLRAQAYASAHMEADLRDLLERPEAVDLAYQCPEELLRWHRQAGGEPGTTRRLAAALALCHVGNLSEGLASLEAVVRDTAKTEPEVALKALGNVAYHGASVDLRRAMEAVERGRRMLGRVGPTAAARFLSRVAWAYVVAGEHCQAKECLERAADLLPPDHPLLVYPLRLNLAVANFELTGDLEELERQYRASVEHARKHRPSNVPLSYVDLGRVLLSLGRREEALVCFRQAAREKSTNFWAATLADAWRACLEADLDAFPKLAGLSQTSEDPALLDWVRGLWARTLREAGRVRDALDVTGQHPGFWTSLERALALKALGRERAARKALPPRPSSREEQLYWHATRYRVLRRRADLDAILRLTTVGARTLPALVPLSELPARRSDLARWYPIEEVLRSGRRAAVLARLEEVPPLDIRVLGGVQVWRGTEPLHLSETAQALVVLMALRLDREAICEALWPDSSAARARNRLHVHLHYLRRALEPWGVPTYLGPRGLQRVRVDLWELEDALHRRDAEAVYRLYREPLAPGVDLPVVDEARWQLQHRVVSLLYWAGLRDETHLEAYLRRVLDLAPWHTGAAAALARWLAAHGREAEARRVQVQAERE